MKRLANGDIKNQRRMPPESMTRISNLTVNDTMAWFDDIGSQPLPNLLPFLLNDPNSEALPKHVWSQMYAFMEGVVEYSADLFRSCNPRKIFVALLSSGMLPLQASFTLICSMILEVAPEKQEELSVLCKMFGDRSMDMVGDIVSSMHVSVRCDFPYACTTLFEDLLACYVRTDPYAACTCSKLLAEFITLQTSILSAAGADDDKGGIAVDMERLLVKLYTPGSVGCSIDDIPIELFFSGLEEPKWMIERTNASEVAMASVEVAVKRVQLIDYIGKHLLAAGLSCKEATLLLLTAQAFHCPSYTSELRETAQRMMTAHANLLILHHVANCADDVEMQECGSMSSLCRFVGITQKDCKPLKRISQAPPGLPVCLRSSTEKLLFRPCFLPVTMGSATERLPAFLCKVCIKPEQGRHKHDPPIELDYPVMLPIYVVRLLLGKAIVCSMISYFYKI